MAKVIEYLACPSCRKERPVEIDQDCMTADPLRKLWLASLCAACQADYDRDQDRCPEIVNIDGGVSVCGGGWRHSGRCFPMVKTEDVDDHIAASSDPPISTPQGQVHS